MKTISLSLRLLMHLLLSVALLHTVSGFWQTQKKDSHLHLMHEKHMTQIDDLQYLHNRLNNCFTEDPDCYSKALDRCAKWYYGSLGGFKYFKDQCVKSTGLFSCSFCIEKEETRCVNRDEKCCHTCWDHVSLCKEDPNEVKGSHYKHGKVVKIVNQNCHTLSTAQMKDIWTLKTCIHSCVNEGGSCQDHAVHKCVDKFYGPGQGKVKFYQHMCEANRGYGGCSSCKHDAEKECMEKENGCCERCWKREKLCGTSGHPSPSRVQPY